MFSLIVDESLKLTLVQEQFAKEVFAVVQANYKHLHEWMSWCHEKTTVESIREFYKSSQQSFAEGGSEIGLSIVYQGKIVGGTGFHEINRGDRSAEIGYWLAEGFTGRGVMTKSVRRLMEYGFDELKLNRLVIKCVPENLKSRAVPERLGFTQEGIEREAGWLHTRFVDHVVYSMLAREWRK